MQAAEANVSCPSPVVPPRIYLSNARVTRAAHLLYTTMLPGFKDQTWGEGARLQG